MKKRLSLVFAALMALSMIAGCGASNSKDAAKDTSAAPATSAQTSADAAAGTVSTDGSTSMEKVIGALGESFMQNNKGVTFTYNPTGSGSGITAVSEGRCDIGLSSRRLKDEEKKSGLKETTLALDGIAVIVNAQSKVTDLIGREAGSGTRDGFESITKTEDKCKYGQELTSTGDVITTVSQNPNAIGYASLAAVKDNVKALSVGKVKPTEETVKDGSYVVQRPFVLVTKEGKALSDTAQKFFDYVTSADASQIISDAGAVPVK